MTHKLTDEERQRLLDTRFDIETCPKSMPRHRGMRMRQSSGRKMRTQRQDPTGLEALSRVVYTSQSEEWG